MTPMRVAIVGCGSIATVWAGALSTRHDVEIVALVDSQPEAAKGFGDRHEITCPVFTDIALALSAEPIDVVCNITPPEVHAAVDLLALDAGCHVLTEKPLTPSVAEGKRVHAAAQAAGRRVSVMQNRRFDPWARGLAAFVASGALGAPAIVSVDYFMSLSFGGFRAQMDNPLLLDMAIHHFDQARYLSPVPAARVSCVEVNPEGSPFRGNAAVVCTFERTDGSLVSYRGSWATPGLSSPWAATWRISGSLGSATWDGEREVQAEVVDGGGMRALAVAPVGSGRLDHAGCIDEMLDALAEDRPAETDIADNLQSLAMVEAAVESARRRQPVDVEQFAASR